jgi:hypothetical protein
MPPDRPLRKHGEQCRTCCTCMWGCRKNPLLNSRRIWASTESSQSPDNQNKFAVYSMMKAVHSEVVEHSFIVRSSSTQLTSYFIQISQINNKSHNYHHLSLNKSVSQHHSSIVLKTVWSPEVIFARSMATLTAEAMHESQAVSLLLPV